MSPSRLPTRSQVVKEFGHGMGWTEGSATAVADVMIRLGGATEDPEPEVPADSVRFRYTSALRAFVEASIDVWREIDRLSAMPEGYTGIPEGTELRDRERKAWEALRDEIDKGGREAHMTMSERSFLSLSFHPIKSSGGDLLIVATWPGDRHAGFIDPLNALGLDEITSDFEPEVDPAQALLNLLRDARDELSNWGHGDFHYGDTPQEEFVVSMVARIDAVLASGRVQVTPQ